MEGPKVTTPSTSKRSPNYDSQSGMPLKSNLKLKPPAGSRERASVKSEAAYQAKRSKSGSSGLVDAATQAATASAASAAPTTPTKRGPEQAAASAEARYQKRREQREKKQSYGGRKTVMSRPGRMGPKDYDLEKAGEIDKFSPSVARLTGRKRAQAIKAHNYPVRSVPEELKARYDRATRRLENTKPENVRARATQDRILRSGKNKNLTGPILPANQQNKDYDLEKGAFLAAIPAALGVAGKAASKVAGKTLAVGGKAAAKGTAKLAAKGAKAGAKGIKTSVTRRIQDKVDAEEPKAFRTDSHPNYQTKSVDLLLDFVEKAQFESGTKKKSPMIPPEAKPNVGKIEHQQHDQDQKDSENAFTLQDKETDVVFQKLGPSTPAIDENTVAQPSRNKQEKDEDIEKQEDNLVTEYSTEQIEKDTELVMADSQVPSTPSMGWFDMLKEELKADVLTDIEMTKSYPDWQQDPEAYSEHREIIKNKITEGYK